MHRVNRVSDLYKRFRIDCGCARRFYRSIVRSAVSVDDQRARFREIAGDAVLRRVYKRTDGLRVVIAKYSNDDTGASDALYRGLCASRNRVHVRHLGLSSNPGARCGESAHGADRAFGAERPRVAA